MVPPEASLAETVRWLGVHVAPLADSPGGSTHPVLFWATALCGFLFARRWLFACVFGTVVASAFLLAGIRMVPLYERLSLWALPALYVGIALSLDAATRWGRNGYTRGQQGPVAAAVLMTVAGLWSCVDIGQRGWRDITNGYVPDSNLGTDDRTGVRWLLAQRRPGPQCGGTDTFRSDRPRPARHCRTEARYCRSLRLRPASRAGSHGRWPLIHGRCCSWDFPIVPKGSMIGFYGNSHGSEKSWHFDACRFLPSSRL